MVGCRNVAGWHRSVLSQSTRQPPHPLSSVKGGEKLVEMILDGGMKIEAVILCSLS